MAMICLVAAQIYYKYTWQKSTKKSIDEILDEYGSMPRQAKCSILKFGEEKQFFPPIPLLSMPGAGNTWLRHVIQQATGFYTGSIYNDKSLLLGNFKGETQTFNNGRTFTIKMHRPLYYKFNTTVPKCIFLLRNPKFACIADVKRMLSRIHRRNSTLDVDHHTAVFDIDEMLKNRTSYTFPEGRNLTSWLKFQILAKADRYVSIYTTQFSENQNCEEIHPIFYEDMKSSLTKEIKKLLEFSNFDDTFKSWCLKANPEGSFHRPRSGTDKWIKKILNEQERKKLDDKMVAFKALLKVLASSRENGLFQVPDNYSFY